MRGLALSGPIQSSGEPLPARHFFMFAQAPYRALWCCWLQLTVTGCATLNSRCQSALVPPVPGSTPSSKRPFPLDNEPPFGPNISSCRRQSYPAGARHHLLPSAAIWKREAGAAHRSLAYCVLCLPAKREAARAGRLPANPRAGKGLAAMESATNRGVKDVGLSAIAHEFPGSPRLLPRCTRPFVPRGSSGLCAPAPSCWRRRLVAAPNATISRSGRGHRSQPRPLAHPREIPPACARPSAESRHACLPVAVEIALTRLRGVSSVDPSA